MSDGNVGAKLTAALAGRYAIARELGSGGMATVYLARDEKHDRNVALKVLRPELAAVIGAERFLTEIKTTANLQHPHILPLFDSGEADGFLFYVMPFIEGETVRDRLNHEKQLPVSDALRITTEVASALDYAHRHGVIHRDIKPENILLHDGQALVADFGIALAVTSAGGSRMTETGMSLGTPHYMSPEQAMGEREITARSDVYALGAVLYEMLTGDPPFTGSTAQAIVARVVTETPRPLIPQRHTIPPHVEAAVLTALEKLPADRFASAAEFSAALANPGKTALTREYKKPEPETEEPAPSKWRAAFPWMVAAMAFALAAVGWLVRPSTPKPTPIRVELEPPDGSAFSEFRFGALSPDGRYFAFVGLRPTGGRVLWIRDLRTGAEDSLHATNGAAAPFWAPDGSAIGYFTGAMLARINADGSAWQQLCPTLDVGGSWNADGVILYTRSGHPMTVEARGGPCTPIAGAWNDSTHTIERPAWLPDGKRFAGRGDSGRVVVSDLAGTAPRPFIPAASDVQFVAPNLAVFTHQGLRGADVVAQPFDTKNLTLTGTPTTLAEDVRTAGTVPSFTVTHLALAYLPAARVDVAPLVVDPRGVIVDSIVRQGTWTFRRAHAHPWVVLGGYGLWKYDLERRTTVALDANHFLGFPVWSPGDSFLVASNYRGCQVERFDLATGADSTLIPGSADDPCFTPSDWTADGETIIVTRVLRDSAGEVWSYTVATGALRRLVSVDGTASAGVVSPDQRWLAYVSNETGELEVYVRAFRGSQGAVRVSVHGGGLPRWSGDGRSLYFETPAGGMMRVAVAPGTTLHLGAPELLFHAPRWSTRLFADQNQGAQATTTYDVSASGDRFFMRQRTEETPDATLILNWQALLGRTSGGGRENR